MLWTVLTSVAHLIDNVSIESHGLTEMCDHFVVTFSISTLAGHNDCVTVVQTICISYNTGKSALPNIYAQCPRASAHISGKARVPVL